MIGAYRSVDAIIEDRLARFHVRRAREQEASDTVACVFAARRGRIVGGMAGAVGGVLVFLSSVVGFEAFRVMGLSIGTYGVVPTWLLAGSGIGALVVAAMARHAAQRRAVAALRWEPTLTGDGPEDVGRIERADPLGDLRARAAALETKSVALPLAALALLAPLTIHGLVALVVCAAKAGPLRAGDFGGWIGLSTVFVGLAHLTLVVRVVLWARSLRGRETGSLGKRIHAEWTLTLFITAIAALVPGVFFAADAEILALIPPAMVVATGAAFLPFAYVATARRLERERAILDPDGPAGELPRPP